MDSGIANLILNGIAIAAIVVWVFGLRFLTLAVREEKRGETDGPIPNEPAPKNIVYGSAELEGAAAELSRRAAAILAEKGVRITERTDERIVFGSTAGNTAGQPLGWFAFRGQIRFTPQTAATTRADYALTVPTLWFLPPLGYAFQALGLAAIIAGYLLIRLYVVDSNDPAVRWQTIQMVQVVHFLWPPFLIGVLYRKPRQTIQSSFETFIHNLQYVHA